MSIRARGAGGRRLGPLRSDRGQSLVELALLLPILVFGLIGASDMARAFAAQLATQNAARAGAEAAALHVATSTAEVASYVRGELNVPGLDAQAATVVVTYPNLNGADYVQVQVTYTWTTIVAWPIVPNTFTFQQTAYMRTYPE